MVMFELSAIADSADEQHIPPELRAARFGDIDVVRRGPGNRNNKKCFRDGTPPEIMALAANPNDRTDPLWERAVSYLVGPEFVYEIKKVDIVKPRA